MTKYFLRNKIRKVSNDAKNKIKKLKTDYCKLNNPYKIGDIISNGNISIQIEGINYDLISLYCI